MTTHLIKTIETFEVSSISAERQNHLLALTDILSDELKSNAVLKLNFICTHNSRRSHLAQVWSNTLAHHYDLNIESFSGGTVATAVYPMVVETLKNQGFLIGELKRESNPLYFLKYSENARPILLFSKTYNNDFNPKSNYMAIMTCSDADENCPIVTGAKKRFALTFEDPKKFDNTPMAQEKYRERSLQIATEINFVFKRLTKF